MRQMTVSFEAVELLEGEDGVTRFLIKTKEPELLIGRDGLTLLALNHIVRKMAEGPSEAEPAETNFIVDVNDYQKNKIEDLKQRAKMMAERARFFKSSVELDPMSSYERMIIHSFLEPVPDVTTESIGQGPTRHIVIRYQEVQNL